MSPSSTTKNLILRQAELSQLYDLLFVAHAHFACQAANPKLSTDGRDANKRLAARYHAMVQAIDRETGQNSSSHQILSTLYSR